MALQWNNLNFETGELRINKQVYRVDSELLITKPKTKSSIRTIILPPDVLSVMYEYSLTVSSKWMFPSPFDDDKPRAPEALGKKMHGILERVGCKQVRYHDLRHPYVKYTTKNIFLQKQKSQTINDNLIVWDFCFCVFSLCI